MMTRLSQPTEFRTGSKAERVERFVWAARAIVLWERVWPRLWPATGIAALFVAAALFDLFALLPWELHALVIAGGITAIGLMLYAAFQSLNWPRWSDGARKLERDSTLTHRPISEKDDALAGGYGDPWAEELWRAHMRARLDGIGSLRLKRPVSDLPRRDPRALRFVVLLLIAAGAMVAGSDWQRRLSDMFSSGEGAAVTMDAWIDPPDYTGEAPIYLSNANGKALAVPVGSTLNLRVHGAGHAPWLSLDGASFQGSDGEYGSTTRITEDAHLHVRANGRSIGDWTIAAIPDAKPIIAFTAAPGRTEHDALKISYAAHDDYGVASVHAIVTPHGRYGKPFVIELPLSALSAKSLSETAFRDVTDHPYAGLDVDIVLQATDGAGQSGYSKAARMTLPARIFTDPLARALVEQRQTLATGDVRLRDRVARTLDALAIAPDRFYANRSGVYLGLRSAYWAMTNAAEPADYQRVQDILWEMATGLERGGLLSAAEELRRLQEMLSQALAQGAPQDVIDALLQRYREAMQRYMQALAANPPDPSAPPPPGAKTMSQDDLDALLKAIEELSQSGARGQAAQMLALLQSLIENMHMTQGSGQGTKTDKALSDAIQSLGDLMGKQRALLDKTFRERQGKADPKDGGPKGLAQEQSKLHDQLNQIMKGLGDQKRAVPGNLGQAGRAMGEAQGNLGSGDLDGAGQAEKNVLEALRKGADAMAKALMAQSGQEGNQNGSQDPLGRDEGANGSSFGGNVKMPGKSDLQRARGILQELRKRAAERGRPQEELDYIDRLLKQF
jgi:uncharacterized protein (TIGR02302 family)